MSWQWCYDFVSQGGCPLPAGTCHLRHDIVRCECGLIVDIGHNYKHHVNGKRHKQILQGTTQAQSKRGVQQERHLCPHCRRDYTVEDFDAHLAQHTVQEGLEATREIAKMDKHGVSVSATRGIDFGIVDESADRAYRVDVLITRTDGSDTPISLTKSRMLSAVKEGPDNTKFSVSRPANPAARYIRPDRPRVVSVTFQPSYAGRFDDTLELQFFDRAQKKKFIIHRSVSATVGDRADYEQLKPTAPYSKRRQRNISLDGPVKRSLRPAEWTPTEWKTRLGFFDIPAHIVRAVYTPEGYLRPDALKSALALMPSSFTCPTYGKRYQVMLWIEEQQMKQELDMYSMTGVEITPKHPRYKLEVAGLAEGRPSVNVGDFILVRRADAPGDTWYEGRVQFIEEKHVSVRFSDEFSTYRGTKFDVRFVLNRLPLRRMHNALMNKNDQERLLFPAASHVGQKHRVSRQTIDQLAPVNRQVGENPEQMETVAAILNMKQGSIPFIIFGPPGTGKTITLVETINQILLRDPNARIVACTPSNSAADHLTEKLAALTPLKIFRLNSLTRKFKDLPDHLRRFSLYNDNMVFAMPSLERALSFNVIISTCISAGALAGLGIKRGHFSYVIVDEAGQGKEPEVMIPIKELADKKTNVVLAGDLMQLGPIVHSRVAKDMGLRTSYLDRLMERPCYNLPNVEEDQTDSAMGITIMQLVQSFRSHPAILRFPNEQFYGGRLQPCADDALVRSLENSDAVVKRGFPVVFHAVTGRDQRESHSPSFFNIDEATIVKRYCAGLIAERKKGVVAGHIGVITPYHAQRMKIKNLLENDPKLKDIDVGSVEEFQGQERRIIIMSTVRSSTNHVVSDIRRALGFVANPQRFNVAVTRAQAMLIVVGNPDVLALDPLWRGFMTYVFTNGGWTGKQPTWDTKAPQDADVASQAMGEAEEELKRMRALILSSGYEAEEDGDIEGSLGDGLIVEQD
ncbi:P-loop containing nucleoside triphosphate hydrolase protein [Cylindrobasidium torrendii FP15055 ss-10]|uniref:RNA helicase n=1 Tax=Cylindrobasidium torrendii FP15055 ss-10 TaxID=1314674 RepID=A0A0D7BAJ1_9AGAR|nr:P-loop containing nucleoside triphosphate hydrolase protein [Cylindrobasidium torrendii FP15055 ss-10]